MRIRVGVCMYAVIKSNHVVTYISYEIFLFSLLHFYFCFFIHFFFFILYFHLINDALFNTYLTHKTRTKIREKSKAKQSREQLKLQVTNRMTTLNMHHFTIPPAYGRAQLPHVHSFRCFITFLRQKRLQKAKKDNFSTGFSFSFFACVFSFSLFFCGFNVSCKDIMYNLCLQVG